MKEKICLLLGGPEPAMRYRINTSKDMFDTMAIVCTGLESEVSFFKKNLSNNVIVSCISWDIRSNITNTKKNWEGKEVHLAAGHWHGKRVKKIYHSLGMYDIIIIDSGEKESIFAPLLYVIYSFSWATKLMSIIAKKIRM